MMSERKGDRMKHYRLLLVYGVILAWLALLSAVKAQQLSPVRIALAGTMEVVVVRDIGPAFTAATGYPVELTRAPSVQLANRIVKGELKPDVYLNSDASVMELLMGPANNDRSRWYLPILRSRTVIAYSPNSRFKDDFDAARAGKLPWYEVLQRPGLVLKRPNPTVDSGGYRAIFVFDLAERHYKIPGLKRKVIGTDNNESQYWDRFEYYPLMRAGQIDAFVTFITNATLNGLPYIDLPEEIDQSNPSMAKWYATASYTNPNGQTFRGTSAAYAVTIPVAVGNRQGAEAFVQFLLSETGFRMWERAGFHRFTNLCVSGDETAVPQSLRSMIKGRCPS